MSSTFQVPFVLVESTFTYGTTSEKNITLESLPAPQRDRVPPRLSTTLRGVVAWVEVHGETGTSTNVDIKWYGSDRFEAASTPTSVEFLGLQAFQAGAFDSTGSTYVVADAQNLGLFYHDVDDSGEFHLRVESGEAGGATGVVTFAFVPEVPY